MTDADLVWNRACLENGGPSPREGDVALAFMLLAHGLVMNGGVLHSAGHLKADELAAACAGFLYFGFGEAAELLMAARVLVDTDDETDEAEMRLDAQYAAVVPDDEALATAFKRHFEQHRALYAPIAN